MSQTDESPLDELRALKREYDAALQAETDPEEQWRLRDMIRKLEEHIRDLERHE